MRVPWLPLGVLIWCLQASLPAVAVTELSLQIGEITDPGFHLTAASAKVHVGRQQQMVIHADALRIGQAEVQAPRITLSMAQTAQLHILSDRIEWQHYHAQAGRFMVQLGGRDAPSTLQLDAQVKAKTDTQWGTLHLQCEMPSAFAQYAWRCADGLYQDVRSRVPFRLALTPTDLPEKSSKAANQPASTDLVNMRSAGVAPNKLGRLHAAHTSPVNVPSVTAPPDGLQIWLEVHDAHFSDVSGLHAGEGLHASVRLMAMAVEDGWQWQGNIDWQSGALFWQPFYFADGNKHFAIRGRYAPPQLEITHALLDLPGVGQLTSQSRIDLAKQQVDYLKIDGKDVNFDGVYRAFIQPLLTHSALGALHVAGTADWSFEASHHQPQRFFLKIKDASVEDQQGKFAFRHVNAEIPWDYDHPKSIRFSYQSGQVLNMPLGETLWQAEVNRYAITAPQLRLPLLDGALTFEDVSAAWVQQQMVWHLKMDMEPMSLARFSQAMGWPAMRGQIDGNIPLVSYANHTLRMAGEMNFRLFNGNIAMSNLVLQDPLGSAPTLNADLRMRDIDLGEITRTFNFGSISGKLEGDVKQLTLLRWKPIYMDAVIQTADGRFPKTISPRAVENITALGGEGTAKALQRTVLRFFNAFDYEKIGIQCALRGDICKMGGVADIPNGFVILKGKGLPAININGYTQYVSWQDVLKRMQRVTDSNSQIVIE